MNIDSIYTTYCELVRKLPHKIKWLAYIFAPGKLSLIVFVSGFISILGSLVVTYGVSLVGQDVLSNTALLSLLILGFMCEGIGMLLKGRFEMLLTVCVRQLSYRRFKSVFEGHYQGDHRKSVLTYPGQISQFAYVVDASISCVNIVAFFFLTLSLYGYSGLIAISLIVVLVAISVCMIHMIGRLWEQYVDLEGKRRHGIQMLAKAMPKGPRVPSWKRTVDSVIETRTKEEKLLRKRVGLQVINGFLDSSALTFTLCLVVVASVWLWPKSSISIGIILAARYFYAAVQNNLVNYRVIRLAVPMMKELDALEAEVLQVPADKDNKVVPITAQLEVVESGDDRAKELLQCVDSQQVGFVPRNPELHQSVLVAWFESASNDRKDSFKRHALAFGLDETVLSRVQKDAVTLSSGEAHRVALAMVLADKPAWLILEDTFAALDPAYRELVANHVVQEVDACSLISSSREYIPAAFMTDVTSSDIAPSVGAAPKTNGDSTAQEQNFQLPDPDEKRATIWKTIHMLFGPYIALVLLGAALLVSVEILFALAVSHADTVTLSLAYISAGLACLILIGCVLYFVTIYYVPIRRLSALHEHIVRRLDCFASKSTSGAITGRLGEDFSELQMDIPGTIGSIVRTIMRTVVLVGMAAAGSPLFFLIVLVMLPLAYAAYNFGTKRILSASTRQANTRGEFLGAVSIQAGLHSGPVSESIQAAGQHAYALAEHDYISSSVQLISAYFLRDGLIQAMVLGLEMVSAVAVLLLGANTVVSSPVVIIYFAITLATGIQSTIEMLQEVGVVGLTSERVALLQTLTCEYPIPAMRDKEFKLLQNALQVHNTLIGLIGPTGAGKSVLLERIARSHPKASVCLIPDVDPLDEKQRSDSGIALADAEVMTGNTALLMLDETFKSLAPEAEREKLLQIKSELKDQGRIALVVVHSRSNLDVFDTVISLEISNETI